MEDITLTATLFILFVGLPSLYLAFLIGIKQNRHLLSSWDDESFTKPEVVGRIMGLGFFLMGAIVCVAGVSLILGKITMIQTGLALIAAIASPMLAGLYANVFYTR